MKRLPTILALLMVLLVCVSCSGKSDKTDDTTKKKDTEKVVETTKKDKETEKDTAKDTTKVTETTKSPETTKAPDTTNAPETQAQTQAPVVTEAQNNTGSGSGGGSLGIDGSGGGSSGGGTVSGGGNTATGGSQDSGNTGASAGALSPVPFTASCKGAYPSTMTTKSGKVIVHTYSDCSVGNEDNSTNYPYHQIKSSIVSTDPKASYNTPRCMTHSIVPGFESDGVLVGYDGYMFYKDTINDFIGQGFLHENIYNRAVTMLKQRNRWAEANGKKFYFVIAPNKNSVYPDYMPEGYNLASYRRYDQFVALLQSAGITAVDLREAMGAAAKAVPERNLYYKYDTHWNNHAGYVAYETTINMIKKDFPGTVLHPKSDYQINYCETYMKDLAYYLGYYDSFKDYGPVYTLKSSNPAKLAWADPKPAWGQFEFAHIVTSGNDAGYSDKLYRFQYQTGNTNAPNVYIMRDSYSIAMTPFLKDSFNKSTYNWTFSFSENEILNAEADVILCIVAERNLRRYVDNTPVSD